MNKILVIFFVILSYTGYSQDIYLVSKSEVKFTSDAPLELIEAVSTKLQGAINTMDRSFAFRVSMKSFDGFNSTLQKNHFNENYLETSKYPNTVFEGKIIEEVNFYTPGTYTVRGKGRLSCHGIETERIIKCQITIGSDGIKISSKFTVLLDDHEIKIPSVVNQKIAEEIIINMNIDMNKKQ